MCKNCLEHAFIFNSIHIAPGKEGMKEGREGGREGGKKEGRKGGGGEREREKEKCENNSLIELK